jgi:hypothetical protein
MAWSFDRRPGGATGTHGPANTGEVTEIWEFIADNYNETPETLRAAGILPVPYQDTHPDNSRLVFMPPEIEQDAENPSRFIVTLKWTSEPIKQSEEDKEEENPLDRKPKITIRTIREKEVAHIDRKGRPKTNTAGDLFDPPIESNRSYIQIEIRKNVTFFPDWAFEFADAVNSEDFVIEGRTILAGRACIEEIEMGEKQFEGPVVYCTARVVISVKKPRARRNDGSGNSLEKDQSGNPTDDVPGPWQTEQLNEGLHAIDDRTSWFGQKMRIQINDGSTPPQLENAAAPVMLTYNGRVLASPGPNTAFFVVFDDHDYLDFNDIDFLWT